MRRRTILRGLAATGGALAAPGLLADGHDRPRVVVVGGGSGGATAARFLARGGGLRVTLIEPNRGYATCYFSNLFLGGFVTLDSLSHGYDALAAEGIDIVHDRAIEVDRDGRSVTLGSGARLPYDRLVLSPGIDFVEGSVPGWDLSVQRAMPHAYKGGDQIALLRAQVEAMRAGGTFALVAPPNPYRCPPGPYERVSMVAHVLKSRNPTAKILIVDPKESFSKQALFEEGWAKHYPGMIERIGPDFGGAVVSVDPAAMMLDIDGIVESVDVCNVIPAQNAGAIAHAAGVTEGGWAPVNAADMSSRIDGAVHVLGDAAAQGAMPKSGFAANSQAKVCAAAIRGALLGDRVFPPRYANTCWSLIADDDGVKVGATYEATDAGIARIDGFISQPGEDAELRAATYAESVGWYEAMTREMFG